MILYLATIKYIKCCSLDSHFFFINLDSLLYELENVIKINVDKNFNKINVVLNKYFNIINQLELEGFSYLLSIPDNQGKIPFKNAFQISELINKIYDFIDDHNFVIKKSVKKIQSLLITSYSNKTDILIE
jgi:hypothetical protein